MRQARRAAQPRVTQTDLAARLATYGVFVDKTAVSKIEHGVRPVSDLELMAIAASLYVPVSWLMGEDEFWGTQQDIPPWPKRRRA